MHLPMLKGFGNLILKTLLPNLILLASLSLHIMAFQKSSSFNIYRQNKFESQSKFPTLLHTLNRSYDRKINSHSSPSYGFLIDNLQKQKPLSPLISAPSIQFFDDFLTSFTSMNTIFPFSSTPVLSSDLDHNDIGDTVPCGQTTLPIQELILKAGYEDSFPWLLTLIPPLIFSVLSESIVPISLNLSSELSFFAMCMLKVFSDFNKPTTPQPMINREWDYFYNSFWESHPTVKEKRTMLMGWFYDQPVEKLRREDAATFLAFLKFGSTIEALNPVQNRKLEPDICKLEREINGGIKLARRGNNEQPLSCMRFSIEPLRFRHKPLVFYAVTHGFQHWFNKVIKDIGFRYHEANDPLKDLSYYYRPAESDYQANLSPLVFVHGVGGITMYKQLIEEFSSGYEGPIILICLPFVSLQISDKIPSITDQLECICRILDKHSKKNIKATFVGHSFGSLVLSWMVQAFPQRVANCVFLDPICFMLHVKEVLFNFHYSRVDKCTQEGKSWNNPFDLGSIINLAGSEMHTNNAMLRHFWWSSNEIWPQDLERNKIPAKILLSEHDDIVPSEKIKKLVDRYNAKKVGRSLDGIFMNGMDNLESATFFVESEILEGAVHGSCALDEAHRKKTVSTILDMLKLQHVQHKKMPDYSLPALAHIKLLQSSF